MRFGRVLRLLTLVNDPGYSDCLGLPDSGAEMLEFMRRKEPFSRLFLEALDPASRIDPLGNESVASTKAIH